jgi:hypothetical protein
MRARPVTATQSAGDFPPLAGAAPTELRHELDPFSFFFGSFFFGSHLRGL